MVKLRNSNNLRAVRNHDTGNQLSVKKAKLDNFDRRWVQFNGANYWYRVHNYRNQQVIQKSSPWIIKNDELVGLAPNNKLNRRNVYAVLPEENWPSNRQRGMSIMVERNGAGMPWRLVNKRLANKYNLKMSLGNAIGLWGGTLIKKK